MPRRPKSWVSSTACRPARPVREPGRVQERLRSQPRQPRCVPFPHYPSPSICSFVCPPIPCPHPPTHIEYQSDVWVFGAQYSRLGQLLHRLAQHREYVPDLGRTVLLLLQCVFPARSLALVFSLSKPKFKRIIEMQRTTARTPMRMHLTRARTRHCGHAALG